MSQPLELALCLAASVDDLKIHRPAAATSILWHNSAGALTRRPAWTFQQRRCTTIWAAKMGNCPPQLVLSPSAGE